MGLNLGWVTGIWLAHIPSQVDHLLNHVEPWAEKRLHTLRGGTGQRVHPLAVSDDRLAAVLKALSDDDIWRAFEGAVSQRLPLAQAVLAYRSAYLIEWEMGRLRGRPLSLSRMYLERNDHATGLIRLLAIGLRVLTLPEFVARWCLAAVRRTLAGLYPGNSTRTTAHPTAERLHERTIST